MAINSGFLYSGMGALRPAFLNRHLGGQTSRYIVRSLHR